MPINIYDSKPIEDWLARQAEGNDDVARWLQRALVKAIRKREESAVELKQWPKDAPAWMKPGGTYHEFRPDAELTEKVSHIRDWLAALKQAEQDITAMQPRGLEESFAAANKYFSKVNQRNRAIVEGDGDTETVMRFSDGSRIARITTLAGLKSEGAQMGHCVGSGGYDKAFLDGEEVFYSLRDAQNNPHATMEVDVEGNILRQCKGKENKPPVEKYMPALQAFLSREKFKLEESTAYCGLVQDDAGNYHSLNNLPVGFSVSGDLNLSCCTGLTALPEGLSVGGGLVLGGCTGLTALPEGLSVGEGLNLSYCTGLTVLPEGLSVGGGLDLIGCTGLTALPEGLSVGKGLNLSYCTGLTALPDGLSVGGSLNLSRCTGLTALPEGLSVGGDLHLDGCTGLTALPEGLSVSGTLHLDGCTGLTALPEGFSVGEGLYLSGCTGLTALPEGLSVKGKIYTYGGTFGTVAEAAAYFERKSRRSIAPASKKNAPDF